MNPVSFQAIEEAALMRLGIGTHCLPAAARAAPWLEGAFRVLGEE